MTHSERNLQILVVDDEHLARTRMEHLLAETGIPVTIAGSVGSVKEALDVLKMQPIDVLLLDIQMPVLDGFDLIGILQQEIHHTLPYVIFVTAYDEFALRAFEVEAVDYLTKPVRLQRLKQSLTRVLDRIAEVGTMLPKDANADESAVNFHQARKLPGDVDAERIRAVRMLHRITLEKSGIHKPVDITEVHYFESRDKLVYARTSTGNGRVKFTLDELENRLDPDTFLRIHRSYILNMRSIRSMYMWFAGSWKVILNNGEELPVARRRVSDLKERTGF